MRFFPFRALIFCVLLPPLAYVGSIQILENVLHNRYDHQLAAVYAVDTKALFNGNVRLQDAIRKNVERFVQNKKLLRWGVDLDIVIKTSKGIYLYPYTYTAAAPFADVEDSLEIARDNYQKLNDGLIRSVDVQIEHNRPLSNAILALWIGIALLILSFFYRRGLKMFRRETAARQGLIDDLDSKRRNDLNRLKRLEVQRNQLADKIDTMKTELAHERRKATANEDEMIADLIELEEKISEHEEMKGRQLEEIDALKDQIKTLEKERTAKDRQQTKVADSVGKRFSTLYKNASVHNRAINGYAGLTEELKIKAEEIIHQLNADPKKVQIKRKVFGKKNRETVFEVIFAYKGRLYFRNLSNNQIEILAIGTKLTQNKDLAFLSKL
ncbi:MAG: hypothetical protein CR984_06655 [Proteobacteria bacterium]|nr:MAG: hypothetical protein CR984_06655 [Pseudomonadota bacterium]PIE68121.1 MAG: hypothetical protein CSA23_00450 [Deltaproteobacteria bacterium]